MLPFIFAASLNVATPAQVTPNRKNIVTLKGAALLANSEPGRFKLTAHTPVSAERPDFVGHSIPSIRVNPPVLRLRDGKSRKFVAHIPVSETYSGPIYLCIITDEPPPKKPVGIVMVSRSCYKRNVVPR